MLRKNPGKSGYVGGACKIRKRGSSSSSASSSVLHTSRFKRGIMVGKRGGSATPDPNWRMNHKSPSATPRMSESSQYNGTRGPISARKLANALWELNTIPLPQSAENFPTRRSKKMSKSLLHQLSDPWRSPTSDRSERSRSSGHRRIMPMGFQRSQCNGHNHRSLDLLSNASSVEIDALSHGFTPTSSMLGTKIHMKELRNCLTTSKDLLKLLSRIWGLEDQNSYGISLLSALGVKLDEAHVQFDHLTHEQKLDRREINCLKKQFLEERSLWKSKERERIKTAVHSVVEELESERKSRRRAERLNKRLGLELANTRATLSKAIQELESERRSREIIERVCDEIVREVGHDKAQVEEIKRESVKVRDEVEKEREMLRLADVWREERVQMKLLDAKVQFEEKNAAVDQLRNELESFLESTRSKEEVLSEERGEVVEDNARDSMESDLRSIELNMESNSRCYSWSYAPKVDEADAKILTSVEERKEGRRTSCHLSGDLDRGRLFESRTLLEESREELNQDAERYASVKGLRDSMLAGSRTTQ